jgi:hypothetical protein
MLGGPMGRAAGEVCRRTSVPCMTCELPGPIKLQPPRSEAQCARLRPEVHCPNQAAQQEGRRAHAKRPDCHSMPEPTPARRYVVRPTNPSTNHQQRPGIPCTPPAPRASPTAAPTAALDDSARRRRPGAADPTQTARPRQIGSPPAHVALKHLG